MKSFADAHKVLASYVTSMQGFKGAYKLDRTISLLEKLGNPQDSFKTIHIAGTSGKTSTCYFMAALLVSTGKKVGLTVSPHIDEVNERVQINLEPLPEARYCAALEEFIRIVQQTGVQPTYFELLVTFAFWEFARQGVDYAVVEVGLGGTLDGTNVITRPDKVCVITDIGLDHTTVLGDTLEEIAAQKAGIIKPSNHVFVTMQDDSIHNVFEREVRERAATIHVLPKQNAAAVPQDIPPFQQKNFALARLAFNYVAERDGLKTPDATKLTEIAHITVPARMEAFSYRGKTVITDGSHNAQKIGALVKALQQIYPGKPIAAMVSFVEGKDTTLHESLSLLRQVTDNLIVTEFSDSQDIQRGPISADKVAHVALEAGFDEVKVQKNPDEAFAKLCEQTGKILLVTGSFYLLNHIRPLLLDKHDQNNRGS